MVCSQFKGRDSALRCPDAAARRLYLDVGLYLQKRGQASVGFQRAYQRQVQSLRAEEIAGGGANFTRLDFAEALLDFLRRDDFAVAKELIAEPHHLVVGAFQPKV